MMKSISKINDKPKSLSKETFSFIKKKYLSLCPDMIISWIIGFFATVLICNYGFKRICATIYSGIWELSLLTMTGISDSTINSAVWYLSSMLLSMIILYPLIRKFKSIAYFVIIPLITLVIFGLFAFATHSIRVPFGWAIFTYRGNLRAFADLGVGIVLYHIVEMFKTRNFSIFSKILFTFVKYGSAVALVSYMYFIRTPDIKKDAFFMAITVILIGLIFSGQTYGGQFFNNKFFAFLGKFSLSLYLAHYYWSEILEKILPKNFNKTNAMLIYLALSLITTLFVMLLSDFIKKQKPFSKIKHIFKANAS